VGHANRANAHNNAGIVWLTTPPRLTGYHAVRATPLSLLYRPDQGVALMPKPSKAGQVQERGHFHRRRIIVRKARHEHAEIAVIRDRGLRLVGVGRKKSAFGDTDVTPHARD